MNAQMLLENFGSIANAPGGVKRLREMIYYLGVTGALCRQEPAEGSGALLLAQVEEEKRDKISKNNFKRSPKLENLRDMFSESLPVIPKTWTWTRLIDIGEISPKNEAEDDAMASFA